MTAQLCLMRGPNSECLDASPMTLLLLHHRAMALIPSLLLFGKSTSVASLAINSQEEQEMVSSHLWCGVSANSQIIIIIFIRLSCTLAYAKILSWPGQFCLNFMCYISRWIIYWKLTLKTKNKRYEADNFTVGNSRAGVWLALVPASNQFFHQ